MRSLRVLALLAPAFLWLASSYAQADVTPTDSFEISGAYVARHLEDRNSVAVIEISGNYDKNLPNGKMNAEPRAMIAREFYRTHADDYDFLVVFSSFEFKTQDALAFCLPIRNDVRGIGLNLFDNSALFGSKNRLRGYIDMAALTRYSLQPLNPEFEAVMSTLAHEILHVWGPQPKFRKDGVLREDLVGKDGAHWSYLLNNGGSVEYGAKWRDNGDGTFTSTAARSFYTPLDLYLMGLLDKSEVPDFSIINNPQIDKTKVNSVNETISGISEQVTIDDIIAAEGARVPDAAHSQKTFRIAFVLAVAPGEQANNRDIASIGAVRQAFASRFGAMTGGRAIVQALPRAIESPEAGVPETTTSDSGPANGQSLSDALLWMSQKQDASGKWQDKSATSVRDTIAAYDSLTRFASFPTTSQALVWLSNHQARNTDYLARTIHVLASTASSDQEQALRSLQNEDGGWGLGKGYASNPLDTALAIRALSARGAYLADVARGVQYLRAVQRTDGGWGNTAKGASRLTTTLAVVAALHDAGAASDLQSVALAWVGKKQNSDGGLGDEASSTHETALAVQVLMDTQKLDLINSENAVRFILAQQSRDGSWSGSVYATAMAVNALKSFTYPNWVVSALRAEPAQVVDGSRVMFKVSVSNTSVTPAVASTLALYDGDPAAGASRIDTISVPPLGPGISVELPIYWDSLDKAGAHVFHAVIDPDVHNLELTRADNDAVLDLNVQAAPAAADIEVSAAALLVAPSSPDLLPATLAITAQVRNVGHTLAAQAKIRLYVVEQGQERLVGEEVRDILGRSTLPVSFSYEMRSSQPVRFIVRADPDNEIVESNESNNETNVEVKTSPSIDLSVTAADIIVPQQAVFIGQDVNLQVTLHNKGTVASPSARVQFRISVQGQSRELTPVEVEIPPGGSIQQSLVWRADAGGDVTLTASIDAEGRVPEKNENNNTAVATFVAVPFNGANLSVRYQDFVFSPAPAAEGASVQLRAEVSNGGILAAENVKVSFFNGDPQQGGQLVGTTLIPLVPAGGKVGAVYDWADVPGAADKLMFVVIDPDNTIAEFSKEDNQTFNILVVNSLPDLAVSAADIHLTPTVPRATENIGVSILVSNLGEQSALDSLIRVRDAAGNIVHETRVASIAAKSVKAVDFGWQVPAGSSSLALTVDIDPDAEHREGSRANNSATVSFPVQDANYYVDQRYISPNGDGVQEALTFFYRLGSPEAVRIDIASRDGAVLRTESRAAGELTGQLLWDGRDAGGKVVKDGSYSISLYGVRGLLGQSSVSVDTNHVPLISVAGTRFSLTEDLTCSAFPDLGSLSEYKFSQENPIFSLSNSVDSDSHVLTQFDWDLQQSVPLRELALDAYPVPSKDGKIIYYRQGNTTWRMDVESRTSQQLPISLGVIAVSSDPNIVLGEKNPESWNNRKLIRYNYLSGAEQELPSGYYVQVIAPDNSYVLMSSGWNGSSTNFTVMDIASGVMREGFPLEGSFRTLPSKDGRFIAFWSDDKIVVFSIAENSVKAVFNSEKTNNYYESGFGSLAWSSDSSQLAFVDLNAIGDYEPEPMFMANAVTAATTATAVVADNGSFGYLDINTFTRRNMARLEALDTSHSEEERKREFTRITAAGRLPVGTSNPESIVSSPHLYWAANESTIIYDVDDYLVPSSLYLLEGGDTLKIQLAKDVDHLDYDRYGAGVRFSALALGKDSGHLFFMASPAPACGAGQDYSLDLWEWRNLGNLTAVLKARPITGVGVKLYGIAQDINFANYRLEYAAYESPNDWHPVALAGSTPVLNDIFMIWTPPSSGKYYVRLTVTDLAGNTRSRSRIVAWNKPVPITDIYRDLDLISPNGDGTRDAATLHYRVMQPTHVTIHVYDAKKTLVRDLSRDHSLIGEEVSQLWDGRDSAGVTVADGAYTLRINNIDMPVTVDNTPPKIDLRLLSLLQPYQDPNPDTKYVWVARTPGLVKYEADGDAVLMSSLTGNDWISPETPLLPQRVRGRQLRLTASDEAGNQAVKITPAYPEQAVIIGHVPGPDMVSASRAEEWAFVPFFGEENTVPVKFSHASENFIVSQTLKTKISGVRVQVASYDGGHSEPPASAWKDIEGSITNLSSGTIIPVSETLTEAVAVNVPSPSLDTSPGKRYLLRINLLDTQGHAIASNPVEFVFSTVAMGARYCGTADECQGGAYQLYYSDANVESIANINFKITAPDGREIAVGEPALKTIGLPERLSLFMATVPKAEFPVRAFRASAGLQSCQAGEYDMLITGTYNDGTTFSRTTRFETPCLQASVGNKVLSAESCGAQPPGKQVFTIGIYYKGAGAKPTLKLAEIYKLRADLSEDVVWSSNVPSYGETSFQLDTSSYPAGRIPLLLRVTDVDDKTTIADASMTVDRTAPVLEIGYPEDGQKICKALDLVGKARDDNPKLNLKLNITEASGGKPSENKDGVKQRIGSDDYWAHISGGLGVQHLEVQARDAGGHLVCAARDIDIDSLVQFNTSSLTPRSGGFSPNNDGEQDTLRVNYAPLEELTITTTVYPVTGVDSTGKPLLGEALAQWQINSLGDGQEEYVWDGNGWSGLLPDGEYATKTVYQDSCGNVDSTEWPQRFFIDTTAPEVVVKSPVAGKRVAAVLQTQGTITELHAAQTTVRYLSGEAELGRTSFRSMDAEPADFSNNWKIPGQPSDLSVEIISVDSVGNSSRVSIPLILDLSTRLIDGLDVAPELFSPNQDGHRETTIVTVSVLEAANLSVQVKNAADQVIRTLQQALPVPAGNTALVWNGLADDGTPAQDGIYRFVVAATATDNAGFVQTEEAGVVLDRTPPVVALQYPNGAFASLRQGVSGTARDAHFAGYKVWLAEEAAFPQWRLQAAGSDAQVRADAALFNELSDGAYRLRLEASDAAENVSYTDTAFVIDSTAPDVHILAPLTDTLLGAAVDSVIKASVAEANLAHYELLLRARDSEQTVTIAEGDSLATQELSTLLTLADHEDGAYILSLRVIDKAGNESRDEVAIDIDRTAPRVYIDQPDAEAYIREATVVSGYIDDAHPDGYKLMLASEADVARDRWTTLYEGNAVEADGYYQYAWDGLPQDGSYVLQIVGRDKNGLEGRKRRLFHIDTVPPQKPLALTVAVQDGNDLQLSWNASSSSDATAYIIYRDGQPLTGPPLTDVGYLDMDVADGRHRYEVTAIDAAGWESEKSDAVDVLVDTTPPTTLISVPASNSDINHTALLLGTAYSADDFREYRVDYRLAGSNGDWQRLTQSTATVSGGQLSTLDIPGAMHGQIYEVRLESEDTHANKAQAIVNIIIDEQAPAAPVLAATANGNNVSLSWQLAATPDLSGFLLFRDGVLVNGGKDLPTDFRPFLLQANNYLDRSVVDGHHEYAVAAMDRAGNIGPSSASFTLVIETRAPHAVFTDPTANDAVRDAAFGITVHVEDEDLDSVLLEYRAAGAGWITLGSRVRSSLLWAFDPLALGLPYGGYEFRATARDTAGNVDTNPVVLPVSYKDLKAPDMDGVSVHVDGKQVHLSWTASQASDLAGYRVYGFGNGYPYPLSNELIHDTEFTLEEEEGIHTYLVTAVDIYDNESNNSSLVAQVFKPRFTEPYSPVSVASTPVTVNSAVAGTLNVVLESATGTETLSQAIAQNVPLTLQLALQEGVTRLRFHITDADGNRSIAVDTAVTQGKVPAAPVNLQSLLDNDINALSWQPADQAELLGYLVYRNNELLQGESVIPDLQADSSSYNSYYGNYASAAVDDPNEFTYWYPDYEDLNPSLTVSWDRTRLVRAVDLSWGYGYGGIPAEFSVQAYDADALRWVDVASVVNTDLSVWDQYNEVNFDRAYATQALRISIPRYAADGSYQDPQLFNVRVRARDLVEQPQFDDNSLTDGHLRYHVTAVSRHGFESLPSLIKAVDFGDVTPPDAVVLSGEVIAGVAELSWSASSSDDFDHYIIYRDGVVASQQQDTFFSDAWEPGSYTYTVAAVDHVGNASVSNAIALTLEDTRPLLKLAVSLIAPTRSGTPLLTTKYNIDVLGLTVPDVDVRLLVNGRDVAVAHSSSQLLMQQTTPQQEISAFGLDGADVDYVIVGLDGRFTALQRSNGEIRVRNRESGEVKIVDTVQSPAGFELSGDGSVLVYSDYATGELVVYEMASAASHRFVMDTDYHDISMLMPSIDGTKVAMPGTKLYGGYYYYQGLRIVDAVTGEMRFVGTGVDQGRGRWSPDSRYISFYDGNSVSVIDTEDGNIHDIYNVYSEATWSSDSKTLAYISDQGLLSEDVTTPDSRKLLAEIYPTTTPEWSPDGRTLLFTLGYDYDSRLMALDIASGRITMLAAASNDVVFSNGYYWTASGKIVVPDDYYYGDLTFITPPGYVSFPGVDIDDGDNVITAVALTANGETAISSPLLVTHKTDRADLEITTSTIMLIPSRPQQGESVRINVAVTNTGSKAAQATTVKLLLLAPNGQVVAQLQRDLPELQTTQRSTLPFDVVLPMQAGRYTLAVEVDPEQRVPEISESNNSVIRDLLVAGGAEPVLTLTMAQTDFRYGESVGMDIGLLLGEGEQEGKIQLDVVDDSGYLVEHILEEEVAVDIGHPYQMHADWDAHTFYAGNYSARVRWLAEDGSVRAEQVLAFAISADGRFTAQVNTDQLQYSSGQTVRISASSSYMEGNQVVSGAIARVRITTSTGEVVFEQVQPLGDWLAGNNVQQDVQWVPGTTQTGVFSLTFETLRGTARVSGAQSTFEVRPTARLRGDLVLGDAAVDVDGREAVSYQLSNIGSADMAGLTVRLSLVDSVKGVVLAQEERTHNLGASATASGSHVFVLNGYRMQAYEVRLETVTADSTGNTRLDQESFQIIDRLPPQVTVVTPQEGGSTDQSTAHIQVKAIDLHTPVVRVELSLDGNAWQAMAPEDMLSGNYGINTAGLTAGMHEISFRARDAAGNVGLNTVRFTVGTSDTLPPVITVSGVADGVLYGNAVTPVVTVQDANLASQTLTLNGQPYVSGTPVTTEGSYTLRVRASDTAANSIERVLVFNLDLTAPAINVNGVNDGALYAAAVTPVISVSDAHPKQSSATLNGQPYVSGTAITASGNYVLAITAEDMAGHVSSRSVNFSIDSTAPAISISGVDEGVIYGAVVTPVISIQESSLASQTITLNTQAYISGTQVAAEDSYVLHVQASDTAGNTAERQLAFVLDLTAPLIAVTGVTEGAEYRTAVTPQFTVTEAHPKQQTLTLNGQPYVADTAITASGSYTLVVTAEDMAGHVSTQTLHFTLDTSSPVISITGVADAGLYGAAVAPVITVQDEHLAGQTITLNGQPYVSGTPVTAEGDYLLQVQAQDVAGNTAARDLHFTLDLTAPVISISGVTTGASYAESVTPVISASDLHPQSVQSTLNGLPYTSGTAISADGDYVLQVDAVDAAGNTAQQSLAFVVDATAPAVTVTGVSNGASYAAQVSAQIAVVEAHLKQQTVTLDGQPYVPGTAITAEGAHVLVARAEDTAGHVSTVTVSFTLDTTAPVITVAGVADASFYGTAVTPVVTVQDDHLATKTYTLNGQPYVSGTVISAEGDYTLLLQATDLAGNSSTRTLHFTLDATAPVIAISGVANGASYASTVTPVVAVSDAHLTQQGITLNNQPYVSGTAITAEGSYILLATATDAAGNTSSSTINFVIDKTAPVVTITAVTDAGMYAATVTPVITVQDASLASQLLTLNGQPYVSGTAVSSEGVYVLTVKATDVAGNVTERTLSFTLDLTAPVVLVGGVTEAAQYAVAVAPVITITEAHLKQKTVTLNGQPYVSGTSITAEGSYTLQATAEDTAGNVTTRSVSFKLDMTAPVVTITGVADGIHYPAALTPVIAVSDANLQQQTLTLNGQPYVPGTAISAEGSYTLRVQARDVAGNSVDRSISFVIDLTAPVINIIGVTEGARYTSSVTPVVSITETYLKQQTVTLNGQPYTGTTISAPGNYTLQISAEDRAGHVVTRSLSFSIAAPVVLAGQLTAVPGLVAEGDPVVLTSLLSNNGTETVSVQLRLTVSNLSKPLDVTVLETTRDLATTQSFTWSQSMLPTGKSGEIYRAVLTAIVGAQSFAVSTADFTMKSAAVQGDLQATTVAPGSTLVLLGCTVGWPGFIIGQPNVCFDTRAQVLRTRFERLGIDFKVVYSESEFRTAMRTGRYSSYWLLGEIGSCSDVLARELREAVNRGATLLVDGGFRSWQNWPLFDVAGAKFGGNIWFTRDEMQVTGTHYSPVTIESAGYHPLRLIQTSGTIEATYEDSICQRVDDVNGWPNASLRQSRYPAVISNSYGRGRAMVFAFDLADSLRANPTSTNWDRFLLESAGYLTATAPLRNAGGEPVQVKVLVENTGSKTSTFVVKSQLPSGMTLLASDANVVTGSSGQLTVNLDLAAGARRMLTLTLQTATVSGTYNMEFELYGSSPSGLQLQKRQSVQIPVRVRGDNYSDIDTALRALVLTKASDRSLRTQALSDLQQARSYYDWHLYDSAIGEMLDSIDRVRSIETVDTQAIRLQMDTLLREYELAWRPGLF